MTSKYTQHYSKVQTPQSQPIPDSGQVQNSAGGYSFEVDDFSRLQRFLVLGSEGGSYYASEQKLTVENATCVKRCLDKDPQRTIDLIVEISVSGRAPKNNAALFALAMAAGHGGEASQLALQALPQVARIGTHLFQFVDAVQHFRGWGRALKKAVGRWYTDKPADKLAYQAIKYQQRGGWSHRDLLRLAHTTPPSEDHQILFRYIVKGVLNELPETPEQAPNMPATMHQVWAFERAKQSKDLQEILRLVRNYRLPHECVPNEFKKHPELWDALLQDMPMNAMVRNLGKMSAVGLLKPGSEASTLVAERLRDQERLHRARLHPIAVLMAQMTYSSGHGVRGSLSWSPTAIVKDALEDAFHLSFQNIEPVGAPTLLALDVSGSMGSMWGYVGPGRGGGGVGGVPGLTPRVASARMVLVTAKTEPNYHVVGFSHKLINIDITANDTLQSAVSKVSRLPFGGTDCALPMLYSLANKLNFHNYVVYTDNETWVGDIHPSQALKKVRQQLGVPGRLAVVGMIANQFSIADPNDGGMLDVVGFDTAAPAIMADFFRGKI
jgi:60 kDa SS-A/Ro ribonucleoprotein